MNQINHFIETHLSLPAGARIVVGVSGGVDSVVLLHVLRRLGYEVVVAHVNYRMRGEASDVDERFVRHLCGELGIACETIAVPEAFREELKGDSFQEAARDFRYRFFGDIARKYQAAWVAVAHHLDDQAETVLMHLLRGSGIEGLAGMAPARPLEQESNAQLIRPLLQVGREQIQAFALEQGIAWREDASNAEYGYRRNAIRHGLLAEIRSRFGAGAVDNIARTADILRGYLDHTIAPELEERFVVVSGLKTGEGGSLNLVKLNEQPAVWQTRLILEALKRWLPSERYAANTATAVQNLMESQVGRRLVLSSGVVWRNRDELYFKPGSEDLSETEEEHHYVIAEPGEVVFDDGRLRLSEEPYRPDVLLEAGEHVCLMDADRAPLPLIVRRWQAGDRLQPLGMTGHKKVSDLLTDAKKPTHERKGIRVVEAAGEIVWVIGVRTAEKGSVVSGTRRLWRMEWVKNP